MVGAIDPQATAAILRTEALGFPTTVVDLATIRAATTAGHHTTTDMVATTDTMVAIMVVITAVAMWFSPWGSSPDFRPAHRCSE